ncbi:MAG TPA: MMPL family transporter, partial [Phenylobacterium sp.]|nr:MMPL family transporter [Phenylobacterium sp.]
MTRWILQHKALVLLAWGVLSLLAVFSVGGLEPRLDYTYSTPGQVGYDSNLRISHRFGIDPAFESEMPVLQLPPGMTMASAEGRALAAKTFEAARATGPIILQDFATTRDPRFLLDGGRATWALISIPNPDYGPGAGIEDRLPKALNAAVPPGAKLTLTGYAQMLSNQGPNKVTMLHSIAIGLALALVVLLLVYGSPIAILPITMAFPSMLAAFLGVFALTYVTPVSYLVLRMIVVISLGISIDFSLMVVIRWREERERGLTNEAAIISATRSAGRAVALSGLTAAVGLGSLVVLP